MTTPPQGTTPPPAPSTSTDFSGLEEIFAKAAADQEKITRISTEGNTEIAKNKEKPKI